MFEILSIAVLVGLWLVGLWCLIALGYWFR